MEAILKTFLYYSKDDLKKHNFPDSMTTIKCMKKSFSFGEEHATKLVNKLALNK